jgi:REP element-mobilizing transposase RayT
MARPLRIEYPGAIHHVMSRGNDGIPIFRDDTDNLRFLDFLAEAIRRFGWVLHDWTEMTNHYHLVIETPECNLSDGMHWLLGRYAQWFNRRHRRRGHLFQERFKNILVERETYLLILSRYLALNPVKAGIVDRPEEYRWSSYRARAGYETAPDWLSAGTIEAMFDADPAKAREEYRRFVDEAMSDARNPLEEAIGQMYLGAAEWVERMQKLLDEGEQSEEMLRAQVHPGRPALEDVVTAVAQTFDTTGEKIVVGRGTLERRFVAYLAFEDGLVQLREIARRLGVTSAGGISGQVGRFRRELECNEDLRGLLESCRSRMRRRPPPFRFPRQNPPVTARRYHRAPSATPRRR